MREGRIIACNGRQTAKESNVLLLTTVLWIHPRKGKLSLRILTKDGHQNYLLDMLACDPTPKKL